jgi:nitrile hydratase beta subunit
MSYISHADLGGQSGHGAVLPEADGELFHAAWEPRALALTLAMGATGQWNIDMSRAARETLPDYARLTYYQIWAAALEKLMLERGLIQADEVAQSRMLHPARPLAHTLHARDVASALAKGTPTARSANAPARFALGARVRTRAGKVDHHTRLPGYVAGKCGVVERLHGPHVFADAHAQGLGEQPQWLYTVAFEGAELWGTGPSSQGLRVSVDAWESYLEAVA